VTVTPTDSLGRTFDEVTYDFSPPVEDETPPTAPAAVAASSDAWHTTQVTWEASTDNVGVAGYEVYRAGDPLASVGNVLSYEDTSTYPDTTYAYEIRARDAAGNLSAPGQEATVATPTSSPFFSDGFESEAMDSWTANNGLVVQDDEVHSGVFAARATSTGEPSYANKTLPPATSDVLARFRFKVISRSTATSTHLFRVQKGSGAAILYLYLSPTGKLSYRNAIAGTSTMSTVIPTVGEWHEVHLRVVGGATGDVLVTLDGQAVEELSNPENLGAEPIGRIRIGDETAGRIFDIAFDTVAVGTG
jgi:hypothetical protein